MRRQVVIQLVIVLLLTTSANAQCPSKDSIKKDIDRVINLPTAQFHNKLVKLLEYDSIFKKCFSTTDSTYTSLLRQIGWVHFDMADYFGAAGYFQQAINIITANANSPSVRVKDLVSGYFTLSWFYDSLNNVAEKVKAADKCIAISIKLNVPSDVSCVRSLYAKVEYYFDIGDYFLCISTAKMCEKYASECIRSSSKPSTILAATGCAESAVGWHVNALLRTDSFSAAETLLADKTNEYIKKGLKNYLGLIYAQLAELHERKGNYSKALSYYNLAFATYRDDGDDFNCKQTLNNIGQTIYFRYLNDNDKALDYYRQALQYKNKGKFSKQASSLETLSILGNIANVYVRKQIYDSAFAYYQVAFNQLKQGIDEAGILNCPAEEFLKYKKVPYLSSLVIDKGDAFLEKYKVIHDDGAAQKALRVYKTADQLLNKIKAGQSELKSKLFWRSDSRRLYVHAVDACYLQKDATSAFYFFERSRAVLLDDQLNEQHVSGSADILNRAQVNKRIAALQMESSYTAVNSKRYTEIQAELFTNMQERHRLEELIKVKSPLYYQGLDSNYVTLADVKTKLLKDHQALLEVFTGDSAVYILLITARDTYFNKINKDNFENAAALYISYFRDREGINKDFIGFRKASNDLYKLIFQNNAVPQGRIIISPDGSSYFPFESLIADNSSGDPIYFLNDHAVSYTYSARYLLNNFISGVPASSGNFLGIAPIQYPAVNHLPALSGSDLSLEKIGSYISETHNLVSKDASKSNFLQQFSAYKIIQLYTHSSDSSDRKEPVIYFADSLLYLSELIPENLPLTQLVVLSACETGNGNFYQGEGVFSFNRGFAAMGIPSSISNLWSVDNQSTYELTEYFYKYLADGSPIDIALQKAKLEFLRTATGEKKLPNFWAPAILVGKTDAIEYKKSFPWKFVFLLSGIATLLAGGIVFFRKKRKL
jgi:CHAT domain-containing protein